jgi:hypothetical protein
VTRNDPCVTRNMVPAPPQAHRSATGRSAKAIFAVVADRRISLTIQVLTSASREAFKQERVARKLFSLMFSRLCPRCTSPWAASAAARPVCDEAVVNLVRILAGRAVFELSAPALLRASSSAAWAAPWIAIHV